MAFPIACIKWVFPSPTPPYKKRGLYIRAGFCETAEQAAAASWLSPPTTNRSKVYLRFNPGLGVVPGGEAGGLETGEEYVGGLDTSTVGREGEVADPPGENEMEMGRPRRRSAVSSRSGPYLSSSHSL